MIRNQQKNKNYCNPFAKRFDGNLIKKEINMKHVYLLIDD